MRTKYLITSITSVMVIGLMAGKLANAQKKNDKRGGAGHIMITPDKMKWVDGPPSLPPGAKSTLLEGDPAKPGPFTLRLMMPASYNIPAHWHPGIEHVTVISGTFYMGRGDKPDTTLGMALPAGSFALMEPQTRHFAWTRDASTIQLHGMGPWGITYVDSANDPRQQSKR